MDAPITTPDGIPLHTLLGIGSVILASEHNKRMTELVLENYLLKEQLKGNLSENQYFQRGYLACASMLWETVTGDWETKEAFIARVKHILENTKLSHGQNKP